MSDHITSTSLRFFYSDDDESTTDQSGGVCETRVNRTDRANRAEWTPRAASNYSDPAVFTVTSFGGEREFYALSVATNYAIALARRGVMSICRDENFDHVFTMGEE